MTTEKKILESARIIFLLYGFHGTTMQRITDEARVNKAAVFYYFGSKENLYHQIVLEIAEIILINYMFEPEQHDLLWFVLNEQRNNKSMFFNSLNFYAKIDWENKIRRLINLTLSEAFRQSHPILY